jgi:hypothetical protein
MFSYFDFCRNPPFLPLVLDDADDDGFFSNTSAYAEKNLPLVIVSESSILSSPLPVVVCFGFLVVVRSKPAPLLAKVPKRFPLLISFPSSSSSHRRCDDDDFPTPFPPREEL